jgi:hypothetical protein
MSKHFLKVLLLALMAFCILLLARTKEGKDRHDEPIRVVIEGDLGTEGEVVNGLAVRIQQGSHDLMSIEFSELAFDQKTGLWSVQYILKSPSTLKMLQARGVGKGGKDWRSSPGVILMPLTKEKQAGTTYSPFARFSAEDFYLEFFFSNDSIAQYGIRQVADGTYILSRSFRMDIPKRSERDGLLFKWEYEDFLVGIYILTNRTVSHGIDDSLIVTNVFKVPFPLCYECKKMIN